MYTKNGKSAWGAKKSSGDGQRRSLGDWPQLGERVGHARGNDAETWPILGGTDSRRHEVNHGSSFETSCLAFGQNQQVVPCGSKSVSPSYVQAPLALRSERQKSPWISKVVEVPSSSTCMKPTIPQKTDSDQHVPRTPQGNCDNMALSNKEEKNLAFKILCKERKAELKAERRRKKENDTLRKMLGPKGVKVTVIDEKIFSKVHDQTVDPCRTQNFPCGQEVQLDSSAFPDLRGAVNSGVKSSAARSQKTQHSAPVLDSQSKAVDNVPKTLDQSKSSVQPKSSKSKKRRDPVVVDIWKAIEICQAAKKLEGGEEGEDSVIRLPKRKEKPMLTGNILDSSNPLRHRGKKRETPRKRLMTRLKKAVMAERKRRREARDGLVKVESTAAAGDTISPDRMKSISTIVPHVHDSCSPEGVTIRSKQPEDSRDLDEGEREEKSGECLTNPCAIALGEADIDRMVKDSLHSRNFREYCNHCKNSDLLEHVKAMLKDIIKFQDRMHATQPIKSESHRRYVVGLRQTQHSLAAHKVKIVILAQDIEKVASPGGLDDAVNLIINSAIKQNVPVVFPTIRRQLGKITLRKVGVSCVGVINYQGSEENYKKIVSSLDFSRKEYEEKFLKEKTRILSELGMLPMKKDDEQVGEGGTVPDQVEYSATLPLLQKLTEAVAELSLSSPSQKIVKDELCHA